MRKKCHEIVGTKGCFSSLGWEKKGELEFFPNPRGGGTKVLHTMNFCEMRSLKLFEIFKIKAIGGGGQGQKNNVWLSKKISINLCDRLCPPT